MGEPKMSEKSVYLAFEIPDVLHHTIKSLRMSANLEDESGEKHPATPRKNQREKLLSFIHSLFSEASSQSHASSASSFLCTIHGTDST